MPPDADDFASSNSDKRDAASGLGSNSRHDIVKEFYQISLICRSICLNSTNDLLPFTNEIQKYKDIRKEVVHLVQFMTRAIALPLQEVVPLSRLYHDSLDQEMIVETFFTISRALIAVRFQSYLIKHIRIHYEIDKDSIILSNDTASFLLQTEKNLIFILHSEFSPFGRDVPEPIENILYGLRQTDYSALRKYIASHGVAEEHQDELLRNIERLVIGTKFTAITHRPSASRTLKSQEVETIKTIIKRWNDEAPLYRGKVFEWIKKELKDYIPGLMAKHLTSNKSLYNTYNKAIARDGVPAWITPTSADEAEDPAEVLARIRAGERARSRRSKAAKRARIKAAHPG